MKITKETKLYIAGGGGMLGQAVYSAFLARSTIKATDIDINEPWLEFGDVRDYTQMRKSIMDFCPDAIINLAAMTDMEQCELEADNAWLTNALGAENLGLLANELDIPYVYISTAGIFGGEKEFFNDFDMPNPLSIYARSKFAGELFVREHVRKYFVIRAGWMMGGGPRKDKKFVNKIFKQIVNGAKRLRVVDDKLGTPTYTHDFAKGIQRLLESDLFGVYNQTCAGSCSRYDIAEEFLRLLELHQVIRLEKVSSDYFKAEYFAPRPASEKLVSMKLDSRGLNCMSEWRVALAEYALEFKNELKKIRAGRDFL
jgi:dTDP-4-dehydrorhamnose reductase